MIYLEIRTKDAHRVESSGKTSCAIIENPSIKIKSELRERTAKSDAEVKVIKLEGSDMTWSSSGSRGGDIKQYKMQVTIEIDLSDLKKIVKKASRAGLLPTRSKSEQKDNPSLEQ